MDKAYMDVEDLDVYQKLCKRHVEVCDLSLVQAPLQGMHQNAQRHGKIIGKALAQQRQALAAGHLNPER